MELSGTGAESPSMHPSNTTWSPELTPTSGDAKRLTLDILTVIVALAGLAGNTVVLWLLGFRMRRNPFSVYILNLAGADCLFLCCQIIFSLNRITLYFFPSNIHMIFVTVCIFTYISGLSILSAISTERCLSVLWPLWYRCRRPRHLSAITCALLWAVSLLLSILDVLSCGIKSMFAIWCPVIDYTNAAWLILLFVLLSGSSLALMTRLLCGSQRGPLTRLYVTLMLTVLVFLFCGLPLGIHEFLIYWLENNNSYYDEFDPIPVVTILSCVNSCANPIIYFFVGSFRQRWWKGRQALRLVLQRALQDTPEVEEHGESLPQETLEMSGSTLGS